MMEYSLPQNILELTTSERIQLVQDIWDSVTIKTDEIPITDSQKQELDRRLDLWEEVKQKLN